MSEVAQKSVEEWNSEGTMNNRVGNFRGALLSFDGALGVDTNNVYALVGKGFALTQLGERSKGVECFNAALKIDPQNPSALKNLGYTYFWMKDYSKALQFCEKASNLDPQDLGILDCMGASHLELKQYKKGLECFDKMLSLEPQSPLALTRKGQVYGKMKEYGKAVEHLDRALEIDPKFLLALFEEGVVHDAQGERDAALSFCDRAMGVSPEDKDASDLRASILDHLGRTAEAKKERDRWVRVLSRLQGFRERARVYDTLLLTTNGVIVQTGSGQMYAIPEEEIKGMKVEKLSKGARLLITAGTFEYDWYLVGAGEKSDAPVEEYEKAIRDALPRKFKADKGKKRKAAA